MYLKLVAWPSPLLIHYQLPYLKTMATAWMYVVPTTLLAVVILVLLWQNRPLGFLGTWAFAILLPTMSVPIILEMAAERRMYLPMLTLIAPLVVGSYLLVSRLRFALYGRRALAVAIGLLAVTFGLVSANRLVAYEDETILWRSVLSFQPDNFLAHTNLGRLLMGSDRIPEAIAELQTAVAAEPDYGIALNNLGAALTRASRDKEAMESFERAVHVDPNYAAAWQNLGNALKNLGHLPEAIEHIEHAIRLKPNDFEAHNNLGVALAAAGQKVQAIDQFREAIRLNPLDARSRVNLAKLLVEIGNNDEAYSQFTQALTLQRDRADVHSYLGAMLGKTGRTKEAIEHFQVALRLDPKLTDAYSNLAIALAIENRPAEAIAISQSGIEVARANGEQEAAQNAEEWLTHYRAELQTAGKPPNQ
jgi:tetratricopeptide (TPR) repeat protein